MIYRHTKSPTLQNKIQRLSSFSPDEYIQAESQEPQKPRNASESLLNAVKVRLWRLVQSKLHRHTRTQVLKPIGEADNLVSRSLSGQEMLERGSPETSTSDEAMEILDPEEAEQEEGEAFKEARYDEILLPENNISYRTLFFDDEDDDDADDDNLFSESPSTPPITYPLHLPPSQNQLTHPEDEEDLFSSEQSTNNIRNSYVVDDAEIDRCGAWISEGGGDVELLDCWM